MVVWFFVGFFFLNIWRICFRCKWNGFDANNKRTKTNKKELRNKTYIFLPVDHDTSRVRVRIHKVT